MAAATEVSICSNALLMLGGQPINNLTENSDRARLASNLYPAVRNYVLRRHPWNCAVKRVALAPDTEVPAFDWVFQYTLPSDFMRVLSVGEAGSEVDYKIESGKLLCDVNPALLRYVWRNENPATWDSMLVWAMTMSMKAVMAYDALVNEAIEKKRLQYSFSELIVSPEMKEIGVGATKDARMASAIGIIAEGYQLPRTPKPEEIFSRAFLPPKAERELVYTAN